MEPEPSTSLFKTKRKMSHFSESEKVMILNMLQYVKETWPADKYASKNEMKDRTAHILGISKSAVYRILKNYTETDMVKAAASQKKRLSLIDRIDDFDKSCIRRIVHNFYLKGELPTAKKVLRVIHSDESLPNMGMTSLRKLLKHMKFKYVKRRSSNALIESNDIALWRIKYLNRMKTYRQQRRPIYYVVETWIHAENTLGKVWEDTTVSKCAKNPTSEDRLIVLHIGGENGFVPQSELVFECHHTDDYQEVMKPDMFENWFQAMLPRLQPNAVVVMDNASYNSRRKEKIPVTSWKKYDIHEWLSSKQISFDSNETKIELLEKVNVVKAQYQSNVVDEMAKAVGIEVLRLPPYHCELNPIELVWADVKGYVAGKNTSFEMTEVKRLLMEALGNISAEKWQNCIIHVKQEEIKLSSLDAIVDKTVDSFVIDVACETSENSYSDSEGSDLDF